MSPQRIQRKRTKGCWRMPGGAVYVGRGSRWGNPFRVGELNTYATSEEHPDGTPMDRQDAVDLFAARVAMEDIFRDGALSAVVQAHLAGKDLACWCRLDQPCHADVLLKLANADETLSTALADTEGQGLVKAILDSKQVLPSQ